MTEKNQTNYGAETAHHHATAFNEQWEREIFRKQVGDRKVELKAIVSEEENGASSLIAILSILTLSVLSSLNSPGH